MFLLVLLFSLSSASLPLKAASPIYSPSFFHLVLFLLIFLFCLSSVSVSFKAASLVCSPSIFYTFMSIQLSSFYKFYYRFYLSSCFNFFMCTSTFSSSYVIAITFILSKFNFRPFLNEPISFFIDGSSFALTSNPSIKLFHFSFLSNSFFRSIIFPHILIFFLIILLSVVRCFKLSSSNFFPSRIFHLSN